MTESQEFNLSVLEHGTTFSTPLKDCSDYDAILSLIKEEIDIGQTEDEAEYQRSAMVWGLATRRRDSESCDSEGVFKSPYKKTHPLKFKSPGSATLLSRSRRRSRGNPRNGMRQYYNTAQRARSLGHIMPGRSNQSTPRVHRPSVSYSDTCDSLESEQTGENDSSIKCLASQIKEERETEQGALEDLLKTAREQVIINGQPDEENSIMSSQGDSTSLATTDPLDTGAMDEGFVESSQPEQIARRREKLLSIGRARDDRTPKTAEMVKKNLHFDASPIRESEEENQNFTLSLSPEREEAGSSRSSISRRRRTGSQDSIGSSLKSLPHDSQPLVPKKEPSTTPLRPSGRKLSDTSEASTLKNFPQSSGNFETTKKADSLTPQSPGVGESSDTSEARTLKNFPQSFGSLENAKEAASSTPPRSKKRKNSEASPRKTLTQESRNSETIRQTSSTPPRPRKKKKSQKIVSSPPNNVVVFNCNEGDSNTTIEDIVSSLLQGAPDGDLNTEANTAPPSPSKEKNSREIASTEKNLASPLKGLSQELEHCLMHDFENICEDMDNDDLETPSFMFETVQLLDDYNDCNQKANNKILSKILSSPSSKATAEDAPIECRSSSSQDPLYIEGSRNVEKIESPSAKADASKQDNRRTSARLKKKRIVHMTTSDWEEECDLPDEADNVARKIKFAKRKANLSPQTLHKLDGIIVKLRDEVLPQHEIENRAGTAPLSLKQQMRFLKFASLNKDTYSPAEDQIIQKNWNDFCKDHDWDPKNRKPFLNFKHGDHLIMSGLEERRKFVQFLANGLPNRPLFSVYSRFKTLYAEYADAGARYSLEEDKMILAYMLHKSNKHPHTKCSELAKVLNRSRFSIWKRYQNLTSKENRAAEKKKKKKKVLTKVTWDLQLLSEFITTLLDVTISEQLIDLKDAFIPKVVWERLAQKMEISYDFLRRSWEQQFHMQFFSPEPLSSNVTKIRLIEYMWIKGIRNSKDIEWPVVVKYFDGCTIPFLRKTLNHLVAHASTVVDTHNLGDIFKWLHTKKIDRLKNEPKDKCLPRLDYMNKKVQFVPEDVAMLTSRIVSPDKTKTC